MARPSPDGRRRSQLAGLTPSQQEAVDADDPVLCVLAGAGAGKTRVLTLRVARRVDDDSAPADHVLVATFSRKAGDELRQRLWSVGVRGVQAGTFHRFALSMLRLHRADRGAAAPVVLGDRRAALARLLGDEGWPQGTTTPRGGGRGLTAAQLDTEIGWAKARLVPPGDYEEEARRFRRRTPAPPEVVARLYQRYEVEHRTRGLLDLDDLLWSAADLLDADAPFADAVRWRFRHLFVDEMQDLNAAQFRFLRLLIGASPDLFVVGDPNQSVYGWNGADPALLDRLPEIFPTTRVIRLDENHRCSPQVVRVASAALGLDPSSAPTSARSDGGVPAVVSHDTDTDEATWVAQRTWRAHRPGRRWSQIAVLARTNAQLQLVAEELARAAIPHRLAGSELGPASDVRGEGGTDDETGRTRPELGPEGQALDEGGDGVVLTTFHRAKGLQWTTVFVIGLSQGLVPLASSRTAAARDEERRLLYVALTRAEDELTCSWVRHDPTTGRPRRPSPWLADIEAARDALEAQASPPEPSDLSSRLADLRALLGPR
ncbi:MAG TPA: ATP-dependent helicase [Acidimicrobiales bacterium]|nr:ATP-dependent helicase [Acidimicrobiales bacterium]